mgnify:FL=1
MTPELLTRLRSWLSADESQYECRLSVNEVREIVGALEQAERDRRDKRAGYAAVGEVLDLCQHPPLEWMAMSPELREFKLKVFGLLDLPCCQLGNGIRGEKPQEPESGQ